MGTPLIAHIQHVTEWPIRLISKAVPTNVENEENTNSNIFIITFSVSWFMLEINL